MAEAADADGVSNTSSDMTEFADVMVTSEGAVSEDDSDLQEATGRLHAFTLTPDIDLSPGTSVRDTDSMSTGAASSTSSQRDAKDLEDGSGSDGDDHVTTSPPPPPSLASAIATSQLNGNKSKMKVASKAGSVKSEKSDKSEKKSKNPFKLLKKLTKWDKPAAKKRDKFSEFEQVRIDKLPQVFVAKYLGCRKVSGFCGLHHVRQPVDEMVKHVQNSLEKQEEVELPLVYVVVSPRGLDIREHKLNKQKTGLPLGLVPIDFISYGVQDIRFWRVFTFIVVKEMSSRSKVTECHAYLCDSSLNARKMALSLGASFRVHSRQLQKDGKDHNFQVELRPPDQLADELADVDA